MLNTLKGKLSQDTINVISATGPPQSVKQGLSSDL